MLPDGGRRVLNHVSPARHRGVIAAGRAIAGKSCWHPGDSRAGAIRVNYISQIKEPVAAYLPHRAP